MKANFISKRISAVVLALMVSVMCMGMASTHAYAASPVAETNGEIIEHDFSNVRKVTPKLLTAVSKGAGKGNYLYWQKVAGASYYEVWVHMTGTSRWYKVTNTRKNSYTHNNVRSGKIYSYFIRACYPDGTISLMSNGKVVQAK